VERGKRLHGTGYEMKIKAFSAWSVTILAVFFALCGKTQAQEENVIWSGWSGYVKSLVNPSNDPALEQLTQIVVSPLLLHWDDRTYGQRDFCSFANSVPKSGPVYEPSDGTVYDHFKTFVESIDVQAVGNQPAVVDAIRQAENQSNLTVVKSSSGKEYSCPAYSFSPRFDQLEAQSSRNKWELGKEQYKSIDSTAHFRIRVGAFVRSSAAATFRLEADDVVKIVIEYSLSRIVIQPGPWFSGTLIDLFKDGPFKASSPLSGSANFFSADRGFPWLPREAVVALRPKVTLILNARAYGEMKQMSGSIQSIDIGPFRFGDVGHDSRISFQEGSKSVTVENSVTTPFLIAVINKPLGHR
jgi:hypothetical protein